MTHYQQSLPNLQLVTLATSPETTTSALEPGNEVDQATAIIRAHPGQTAFITIDLGGDDIVHCGIQAACFAQQSNVVRWNLTVILAKLHAAAPEVPVYGMNYYDPFLVGWLSGGDSRTGALRSIPLAIGFDHLLTNVYGPTHTANVETSFAVPDTTLVAIQWGKMPLDVANTCRWLDVHCSVKNGFRVDGPNDVGAGVIANAFEKVIGPVLTIPPVAHPTLLPGQRLLRNQSLIAGPYRLVMQGDGNLVEYQGTTALWASVTAGHPGAGAVMQKNGNLVIYFRGRAIWASRTSGNAGAHLSLQASDGNVAIYTPVNKPVWATGT